jgi:hypothetical protein
VVDVAGRIVRARELGTMGAGEHTIELSGNDRLAPGLYFIRLEQGAERRTMRAVVLK